MCGSKGKSVRECILLFGTLAIMGLGLANWSGRFIQNYKVYCCQVEKNKQWVVKVKNSRQRLQFQNCYLHKVLNDQDFRENLIRERLGYVKANECVVRFDNRKEAL